MPRRFGLLLALVTLAIAGLSACGGSSSGGGSSSSEPTKTATNGAITVDAFDIHFDVGVIKTAAGPLTVTLVNKGAQEHTFKIEDTALDLKANGGKSATGTVTLAKGTYKFECTIPGHAQQGMKGTVEVS
jgi:plastocyanin